MAIPVRQADSFEQGLLLLLIESIEFASSLHAMPGLKYVFGQELYPGLCPNGPLQGIRYVREHQSQVKSPSRSHPPTLFVPDQGLARQGLVDPTLLGVEGVILPRQNAPVQEVVAETVRRGDPVQVCTEEFLEVGCKRIVRPGAGDKRRLQTFFPVDLVEDSYATEGVPAPGDVLEGVIEPGLSDDRVLDPTGHEVCGSEPLFGGQIGPVDREVPEFPEGVGQETAVYVRTGHAPQHRLSFVPVEHLRVTVWSLEIIGVGVEA